MHYSVQGDVLTLLPEGSTEAAQLTQTTCQSYDNSDNCPKETSSTSIGLIIGIACGGGVLLLAVLVLIVCCCCIRSKHQDDDEIDSAVVMKEV